MASSSYTPIACSVYDLLESSAVTKKSLRLEIISTGTPEMHDVTLLDVFSQDRAEYLRAKDIHSGEELTLRLDQLSSVVDIASGTKHAVGACTI